MSRRLGRFEGRLFAEDGCLFLVVHTDEAGDLARVTCRVDGQTQVIEMPLSEVARRLTASPGLLLDNLNGPQSAKRLLRQKDGWYFLAREGQMGPFGSEKAAGQELVRYILSMQASNDGRREPGRESLRSAESRRIDGVRRPAERRQAL